jgi:uncharacterized small protein (DUF1192 family)
MAAAPLVIGIGLSLCTLGGVWLFVASRQTSTAVSSVGAPQGSNASASRATDVELPRVDAPDEASDRSGAEQRVPVDESSADCAALRQRVALLEREIAALQASLSNQAKGSEPAAQSPSSGKLRQIVFGQF